MKIKALLVVLLSLSGSALQARADNASNGIEVSGDYNNDGFLDLAVLNPGYGTVSIFVGNGDGTFNLSGSYKVGGRPTSIATGDFDNDGNLDLVTTNSNNKFSLILGSGTGTFGAPANFTVGSKAAGISVGDFNADGNLDVATTGGNTVSISLGNGAGSFATSVPYGTQNGHVAGGISIGDLNNDSALDLVILNTNDSTVSVLLGVGNGTFAGARSYPVGNGHYSGGGIALGDFNGDGALDVANVNSSDSTVSILVLPANEWVA